MNKSLLISAVVSVLLAIILIPMIIFKPWISIDPLYVGGKLLYLRVTEPIIYEQVIYSSKSQSGDITTFRIKPINSNNELAVVNVELTNNSISPVKVLIGEKSTELLSMKQGVYSPLNSVLSSKPVDSNEEINVIRFIPLWGSFDLFSREMVKGSMVFEVPANSVFAQFSWLASDSITISYKK